MSNSDWLLPLDRDAMRPLAQAVRAAYRAGEDDEAMEPLVCVDGNGCPVGRIRDGDYVIFYDIRGEREIELTEAFVADTFPHFPREPMATHWATMIQYHPDLDVRVAFPPLGKIQDTFDVKPEKWEKSLKSKASAGVPARKKRCGIIVADIKQLYQQAKALH